MRRSTPVRNVQQPIGFADIVEHVKPSVISVSVKINEKGDHSNDRRRLRRSRRGRRWSASSAASVVPMACVGRGPRGGRGIVTGQGSGFFISADGYAVTNNHVVDSADKVEVTTDDGKTYSAKVIGTDARTDLALIKVEGRSDFPFAKLSEAQPRIGDWVLAVGNPFGLGGTVTAGIVSASWPRHRQRTRRRLHPDRRPGQQGQLRWPGVQHRRRSGRCQHRDLFAVRWQCRHRLLDPGCDGQDCRERSCRTRAPVSRGWIGVQIQPVTQEIADSLSLKKAEGALVAEPQADGPAAKAGVQSGDVITAVNDKPVRDARELARTIGGLAPGSAVKLNVLHKGQDKTINLTLGELPNAKEAKATPDSDNDRGSASARHGIAEARPQRGPGKLRRRGR